MGSTWQNVVTEILKSSIQTRSSGEGRVHGWGTRLGPTILSVIHGRHHVEQVLVLGEGLESCNYLSFERDTWEF